MKHTIAAVFSLLIAFSLFSVVSNATEVSERYPSETMEEVLFANYSDAGDISNQEAVAVLTGAGVLNGMGDGTFQPNGLLTRAQTAKLISVVTRGGKLEEIESPEQKLFDDVPVNHWAVSYIYDGVRSDYLHGMGDGTFHPEETVTASQLAVILDRLLGIRTEDSARIWPDSAMLYAEKLGLLKGIDKSAEDGLNREEAALMIFHALQADLQQFKEENEAGEGVYFSAEQIVKTDYKGRTDDQVQQLIENFFPDLTCNSVMTDALGHSVMEWKRECSGFFMKIQEEPIAVITRQVDAGEVESLLGGRTMTSPEVYLNGCQIPSSAGYVKGASDLADRLSGNGVRIELYSDETGTDVSKIIILQYQLKEVVASDYSKGSLTLNTGSSKVVLTEKDSCFSEVAASVKGDWILAAPAYSWRWLGSEIRLREDWSSVVDAYLPKIAEGSITDLQNPSEEGKQDGAAKINHISYQLSSGCRIDRLKEDRSTSGIGWLDRYGYLEGYQPASDQTLTDDWVLVKEIRKSTQDGQLRWFIKGITEKGEKVEWRLHMQEPSQIDGPSYNGSLTASERADRNTAECLNNYLELLKNGTKDSDYIIQGDSIYLKNGCAAIWTESADGFYLDADSVTLNNVQFSVSHVVQESVTGVSDSIAGVSAASNVKTIKVYGNSAEELRAVVMLGLDCVLKGSIYVVKTTPQGKQVTTVFVEGEYYKSETINKLIRITKVIGKMSYLDQYETRRNNGYLVRYYDGTEAAEKEMIVEVTPDITLQPGWYTQLTTDGEAMIPGGAEADLTVARWDTTTKSRVGGYFAGKLDSGYNGMISPENELDQVYFFTGDEAVRDLSGRGIRSVDELINSINRGILKNSRVVFAYSTKKEVNTITQLYILN